VPTERQNADAPVPQEGTEQTVEQVTDQIATQQPPPAEESSTAEKVCDVVEVVSDGFDVVSAILSFFAD
jgi:hypothetical protein